VSAHSPGDTPARVEECRPSVCPAVHSNLWEVCCACGWISALFDTKRRAEDAAQFHAIRPRTRSDNEQALAEAKADAWDEGAGWVYEMWISPGKPYLEHNPHRAALRAPQGGQT